MCDYVIVWLRDCVIGLIFCMHERESQLEYMLLDTSIIQIWPNLQNLPLLCDYVIIWLCDCVIGLMFGMNRWDSQLDYMLLDIAII